MTGYQEIMPAHGNERAYQGLALPENGSVAPDVPLVLNDEHRKEAPATPAGATPPPLSPRTEADTARMDQAASNPEECAKTTNWHVEAGRKGARRIHQLIEQGRLYEQEHGLKRGRQRLRQLVEEGKRYEQEHDLNAKPRSVRRSRASGDQLLHNFFDALIPLVKPTFRPQLERAMQALASAVAEPNAKADAEQHGSSTTVAE